MGTGLCQVGDLLGVVNKGGAGVSVLDLTTPKPLAYIDIAGGPHQVAVHPSGAAVVFAE